MYALPALLTPLPLIPFTTEEITGCKNEAATSATKAQKNPSSYFFILCFTVSVTPSINIPESSKDFIILIISFINSFEINKIIFFLLSQLFFYLFFFQIYLLHLKLNCSLIQVNCL